MSYTPIQLDKMRNFRYGMKAISIVEKKFEKPIAKIDFNNLTMEDTAIIIWAGLQHEDKELTPDRVMDIIDESGKLQETIEAMGEAVSEAFGKKDSKEVKENKDEEKNK